MRPPEPSQRLSRAARFRLSPRGQSTAAHYSRSLVAVRRKGREAFERAQHHWATSHGLDVDDGAYLSELAIGPLNAAQLGEAMAVCGQTRALVLAAIRRLLMRGFLERDPRARSVSLESALDRAEREVIVAEAEFTNRRTSSRPTGRVDRRFMDEELRQALYRVVVARRFLDSLV